MTLSKLNSASQNTQISTLYVKQMPHHRDVCLRRMDNGRTVVNQCVSPVEKSISPRYDVNLWHPDILWKGCQDILFSNPTYVSNIYGKFCRNPSTKYTDIAAREIGVNGRTTDGRTIGKLCLSPRIVGGGSIKVSRAIPGPPYRAGATALPLPLLMSTNQHVRLLQQLHCVSKNFTLFIFLWLLGQIFADFNNVWSCCSRENVQSNDLFLSYYNVVCVWILLNGKTRVILHAFNVAASSCRHASFLQLCFKVYSVSAVPIFYLEIPY